jgi:hypothetical protein
MSVEFEIEHTFAVSGRGTFVAARPLTPRAIFTLPENPTLGGVPIERWFDIPRSLDRDGQPRTDYVVFQLTRPEDRTNFQPGQRVVLR